MTIQQLQRIKLPKDPYYIEEYTEVDDFGAYMTGTFAYGKSIVIVSRQDGRWHLSIKNRIPLGLHQITSIRDVFVPDDVKMAHVLPSRSLRHEDATHVNLWEVQ